MLNTQRDFEILEPGLLVAKEILLYLLLVCAPDPDNDYCTGFCEYLGW